MAQHGLKIGLGDCNLLYWSVHCIVRTSLLLSVGMTASFVTSCTLIQFALLHIHCRGKESLLLLQWDWFELCMFVAWCRDVCIHVHVCVKAGSVHSTTLGNALCCNKPLQCEALFSCNYVSSLHLAKKTLPQVLLVLIYDTGLLR